MCCHTGKDVKTRKVSPKMVREKTNARDFFRLLERFQNATNFGGGYYFWIAQSKSSEAWPCPDFLEDFRGFS